MSRPGIFSALAITFVVTRFCAGVPLATQSVGVESDRVVAEYRVDSPMSGGATVRLIEVRYGPSASSPAHRHQCPVIGYVVDGQIKSQVDSGPITIYKTGQSFYEAAGSLHAVSANGSATRDAKLLAVFVCHASSPVAVQLANPVLHQ